MACMDYMDPDVCCLPKRPLRLFTHSLWSKFDDSSFIVWWVQVWTSSKLAKFLPWKVVPEMLKTWKWVNGSLCTYLMSCDVGFTVYPKKYAHGFVVLCFVVVLQSIIMNSHEVFIHIHQGCFAGTGAIVRLPQCQWSKPDGYGIISQCITTTKHSKANTVCIFLGIYCIWCPEICHDIHCFQQ